MRIPSTARAVRRSPSACRTSAALPSLYGRTFSSSPAARLKYQPSRPSPCCSPSARSRRSSPAARGGAADSKVCWWESQPRAQLTSRAACSPHADLGSRFDENVVTLSLHRVASQLDARVVEIRAGRDVVFPAVPRADDRGAVEFPLRQRAAAMLAGVVDREEPPARVEQRNLLAVRLDQFAGALGQVRHFRNFDEACHPDLPPLRSCTPR